MTPAPIEGVIPILVTPFMADGSIDEASLARLIDFNIGAGVHALGVALGSEVFKFTEAERQQVIGAVVRAVAGRVPVIINTGATGTDLACHYARMAARAGAGRPVMLFAPVPGRPMFPVISARLMSAWAVRVDSWP